ncbi:SDR family oxidoreductase [Pelagibacterium mangrovi]|uniref:SDR family oxidoreductase n=1 Tax=Pelagibacterium mangrovi TaxID=3119828 RepID=UPI002FC9D7F8
MMLEGRIALVTGGGSGLGKASALKLATDGADIALLSRSKEEVDRVATQIANLGRKVLPLYADISDTSDMQSAFDQITETFGRLDIVFANAGINGTWAPIDELPIEDWDTTIAVNLRGTFLTLRHAVPLMKERGGSIIITSSINGTRTFTTAGASAYSTTKAGQLALAQMTALELAKYRIRVNAICPGAIESEIDENTNRQNVEKAAVPAKYPKGEIPLTGGEPGKAKDVADLVCFLASDAARHITGTPIWIDGAQSLLV